MENSFFHRLSRMLWVGLVILIVALSVYVSAGRLLMANIGGYREAILQELNVRFPFSLEAQQVSGDWHSFSPELVLTNLRLSFPDSEDAPVELSEGRIGVDVLNSLWTRSLQLNYVALTDLTLRGSLGSDGRFNLIGFTGGGEQGGTWLREFLLNIGNIALRNNILDLTMPNGEVRQLDLNLMLARRGSHRRIDARLASTAGMEISILAAGVGDPLQPESFTGNIYVNVQTPDLGAARAMLANGSPPFWLEGAVNVELWVALEEGQAAIQASLQGRQLLLAEEGSSRRWPLEHVAVKAHLVEQKQDHWTLYASDFRVQQDGIAVELPRVQLDAWGGAVRLRLADVPLAPINAIATGLEEVPEALRGVFATLQPRGLVSTLQLSVEDMAEPARDWEVTANFRDVEVEPYGGAPGVKTASGYAQLAPGGGFVVIDSQPLTLSFPKIYHQPLEFDDLHGTLNLAWDDRAFSISSGLVTANGEEGRAQVLFGLDIPLLESVPGIEMDLLVGLQDFRTRYRDKYIPYTLSPRLLDWLADSIGDGQAAQGAFLWRGSLARDGAAMRTVQLAFNVLDTPLDYHPQWPPVTLREGVVLIDDAAVSVWADNASLFESELQAVSVETYLDGQNRLMLDITGRMSGPADDGLQVLNDSALTDIAGGTFEQWQMDGNLEADINISLNLTDNSVPPQVAVATRWADTDLLIVPGNLPVKGVNGAFDYSTDKGFSSSGLTGEIWGKALDASVVQRYPGSGVDIDRATSLLEVTVDTRVDMADLQAWLSLGPLALASGEAAVQIAVQLPRGGTPVLLADSDLEGVALDLPAPWRKAAQDRTRLHFELPLTGGGSGLQLKLGEVLQLNLEMEGGELQSGALGINAPPARPGVGDFIISGYAPLVNADDCLRFVSDYFSVGELFPATQTSGAPASNADTQTMMTSGEATAQAEPDDAPTIPDDSPPLRVLIEQVLADELIYMDRHFQQVAIGLALEPTAWNLSVYTDWLQGSATLSRDSAPSTVTIDYLNLEGLPEIDLGGKADGDAEPEPVSSIPPLQITLDDLYQGEARLGNLAFSLQSVDGVVRVENIQGELAGMGFNPDQPGQLLWFQGAQHRTEVDAQLIFGDLGNTLAYFDYQRIVKTRKGQLDVALKWPGSPLDFSLASGRGSLLLAMGKGSFPEASAGASGALRVVNILNLADIVGRLSLSHMFDSGISFDSVDGEIYMHGGTVEVARMEVKGPGSFRFAGVSDVASKSLKGELVATLPVANNLPWVAALAASLPITAGVFIVSKVFNKQMNRLSSAVYTIDGSWNEPNVRFDRIFDDSPRNSSEAPSEQALDAAEPDGTAAAAAEDAAVTPGLVQMDAENTEATATTPLQGLTEPKTSAGGDPAPPVQSDSP